MQSKLCTRCRFVVEHKSKLCRICGNKSFVAILQPEASVQEEEAVSAASKVRSIMNDFADDVALTAEKSVRAWEKVKRLIS